MTMTMTMNVTNRANFIQPSNDQGPERMLVIGLGLTGYSAVKYLVRSGMQVTAADSRELPPYLKQVKDEFPQVEIITGQIPYARFGSFKQIVASPGVEIERQNFSGGGALIGDIELFVRQAQAPIIAITGSNGKSTVTMLVAEMLLAAGLKIKTGGNIGTPVLDLLDPAAPDYYVPDYYVLELSSFQLETTHSLRARAATVLNISADHMDRYRDMDEYIAAKARILHAAAARVLNRDDAGSKKLLAADPESISFGMDRPADNHYGVTSAGSSRALVRGDAVLARAEQITLQGEQNIANILAAMALVEAAGVALNAAVVGAALNYGGLPHRCEMVAEVNGVKWINDSKGTNVGATIAAINGVGDDLILIAGGIGKGADFSPLAAARARVRHAVLFGQDAEAIAAAMADADVHDDDGDDNEPNDYIHRAKDLTHAVSLAAGLARAGQTVLFSPACASFDMFDNYEHRGNVYKQLVWELVH